MINQTDHRVVEIEPKVEIVLDWEQFAHMIVAIMRDGTPDGKADAASEVIRMGRIIDQLIAKHGTELAGSSPFDRTEDRPHG